MYGTYVRDTQANHFCKSSRTLLLAPPQRRDDHGLLLEVMRQVFNRPQVRPRPPPPGRGLLAKEAVPDLEQRDCLQEHAQDGVAVRQLEWGEREGGEGRGKESRRLRTGDSQLFFSLATAAPPPHVRARTFLLYSSVMWSAPASPHLSISTCGSTGPLVGLFTAEKAADSGGSPTEVDGE